VLLNGPSSEKLIEGLLLPGGMLTLKEPPHVIEGGVMMRPRNHASQRQ
jgi:hypothetical protein